MEESISGPAELSPYAPRIVSVKIPADRIGELIGPGGKNIKGIQAESGAQLSIDDDGTVHIYASKQVGLDRAKAMIDRMFAEIEVGKTYTGRVVSVTAFGAFMEVLPGKDGLVHVSELAEGRVEKVEDVVKKGDTITAKCLGVDEKGRVKMSRKAYLRELAQQEAAGTESSEG
jgi:polyribonucleotide nucleotidyltransferase